MMTTDKPAAAKSLKRERVLDAAERLLARDGAAFSMRELAEEAGVSFATPFNQFGSKGAIVEALSARRIVAMRETLARTALPDGAVAHVLGTAEIAAAVMLRTPAASRAVMGALGATNDDPAAVLSHSRALWADALGTGDGLAGRTRTLALAVLPDQLAIAFRGVLSFWTAGELSDEMLPVHARAAAATVLLGFSGRQDRINLLELIDTKLTRKMH